MGAGDRTAASSLGRVGGLDHRRDPGVFPESRIAEEDYASLVASMPGADPGDRHHMAAAISGRAQVLVTWNLRDFPAEPLAALGLRVANPDEYLCEVLDQVPQEVTATVLRLAGEKRRPPKTPTDLVNDLAKAGIPAFADRLQATFGPAG